MATIVKVSQDDGQTWKTYVETPTTPPPPPVPPPPTAPAIDKNGIAYPQPLESDGYRLSYSNEAFTFTKNFRSDGSMRCDFKGLPVRDSAILAGYFKVSGTDNNEEVAAKLNGGPHSSSGAYPVSYADVMDMGITNFAGNRSRVRWEKDHPIYSSGISSGPGSQLPIGDVRNKWLGYAGMKVNLDTDSDGKPDKVALIGLVDVGGLDAENKPLNQWRITFKRIFLPSEIGLKSVFTPYVASIGKPELCYQTIRIDQQSQSVWQSSSPPYKFVTVKEITATKI